MLFFVTGASGYIGTHLCKLLVQDGHKVLGLARSDRSAEKLKNAGYEVLRGEIVDLDILKQGAQTADGVIHLAFDHDNMATDFVGCGQRELAAVKAMGSVLIGTNKPFITTSGTLGWTDRTPYAVETDPGEVVGFASLRIEAEQYVISLKDQGVRSMAVRLPPSVHSDHDQGLMATLVGIAQKHGFSGYIGQGNNVWPTTHVTDVAVVYQLAIRKGKAGSSFHAVAEEGVEIKTIAEAIGESLGLSTKSVSLGEAHGHFGMLAVFLGRNNPTSSKITREVLGWEPVGPTLLEDLKEGRYLNRQSKYSL